MAGWQGLLAPAQTPKAIADRLEQEAIAAARTPLTVARLKSLSVNVVGRSSAEFAEGIRKDVESYQQVISAAGLEKQQ
jgi:tripartite-type tricarboxylate transporter receptor subunit TctC